MEIIQYLMKNWGWFNTHSSVLAWRIPGMGEPDGESMGPHRVGHDWSNLESAAATLIGHR